ncbi:hypothetical protein GCM10022197_27500 [Microlunatus spumicola]|uniref:HNH endonuclease n=1 Tax=Microlunatus spumicola TaxID=81499 RepID=A0ABP6XMN4_9ACTN
MPPTTACRVCMRAYQAAHHEKNRERHIARVRLDNVRRKRAAAVELETYLRAHPCVGCGTTDVRVLELDHREDETKSANVSAMVGAGLPWARIEREIAKCDVRCANCHRVMTMARGGHFRHAWSTGPSG